MPNSARLRPRRSKLVLVGLFAALALLAANLLADRLGLKYLHPGNKRWYLNAYAQQRTEQVFDMVFLGSSKTRFGVNVTRVAEVLAEEGHGPLEAFNLAQPAGSAVRSAALLRDLIDSRGCPSLVVLEVSRTALRADGVWWRLLGDYASMRDLPVLAGDLASFEHADGYLSSATRGFERFYDHLVHRPGRDEIAREIRRRGSQYRDRPRSFPRLAQEIDLAPPAGDPLPPRGETRVFVLDAAPKRALLALADAARQCSAPLVLISLPTVPALSRPHLTHFEQQLRSEIERFSAQFAGAFVDFNQIDLGLETRQFRDWGHLNYEGAEVLSSHLARRVLAPLLEARRETRELEPTSSTRRRGTKSG